MLTYPNPEWVADHYTCEHGHVTPRYRAADQDDVWDGVVNCCVCGSRDTKKTGVGTPVGKFLEQYPYAPHITIVVVKPEHAPLRVLSGTLEGIHMPPSPTYIEAVRAMARKSA